MHLPTLPPGYTLIEGPPAVEDYMNLRQSCSLVSTTRNQTIGAINGTWYFIHIVHSPDDSEPTTVGMGRIFGDGGWYFIVADLAVLPAHQRKGLGNAIVGTLMDKIGKEMPGAYVSLAASEPGRRLYERHGFVPSLPKEMGMCRRLPM